MFVNYSNVSLPGHSTCHNLEQSLWNHVTKTFLHSLEQRKIAHVLWQPMLECFYHSLCLPMLTEVSYNSSLRVRITKVWQRKRLQRTLATSPLILSLRLFVLGWDNTVFRDFFVLFTISDQRERIIRWQSNFHLQVNELPQFRTCYTFIKNFPKWSWVKILTHNEEL